MNICRKTTIFFLVILIIISIVVPPINANKVISVTNILPDPEPPVTSLYFDGITGYVTLIAIHYPLDEYVEITTYYRIDSGEIQTYTEPFKIPEGRHIVEFWSVDMYDNQETHKKKTLMFDTTPPTVELIYPEEDGLYIFGNRIMNRILNDTTLCIGQVSVEVYADDKDGYGVSTVYFSYSDGETSYDDNSSDGWRDIYSNIHFGSLTISVCAMDKKGLISEPVNTTIRVYSFGFFYRWGPIDVKKLLMDHSLKGDVDLMHYNCQSEEDLKRIYDKVMVNI